MSIFDYKKSYNILFGGSYHLAQKDWDEFIHKHDGIHCNKMCKNKKPNQETKDLFENENSSDLYCSWCQGNQSPLPSTK